MNLFEKVTQLVSKLPAEGLPLLVKLVNALLSSPQPLDAIKRATMAAAAKRAIRERF